MKIIEPKNVHSMLGTIKDRFNFLIDRGGNLQLPMRESAMIADGDEVYEMHVIIDKLPRR